MLLPLKQKIRGCRVGTCVVIAIRFVAMGLAKFQHAVAQ